MLEHPGYPWFMYVYYVYNIYYTILYYIILYYIVLYYIVLLCLLHSVFPFSTFFHTATFSLKFPLVF